MVQSKRQLNAYQNSTQNSSYEIIFWNAGGLTETKATEFENILENNNADLFAIIDAGSFCENNEKLSKFFKNFQLKTLKRGRRISSGILVGVKTCLSCQFKIIKEMNDLDKKKSGKVDKN